MPCIRYLLLTFLLTHSVAEAHLLKVFAYVEGNNIHGSVYFAGGSAVEGALITIKDPANQELANLKSSPQGEFFYQAITRGDYQIYANTGDGHQAEWMIKSDAPIESPLTTHQSAPAEDSGHTNQQVASLVEQAVARQIGPLRESLQRNMDRARLSDILGGVGFIFGIAGIALWWRSKQHPDNK